MEQIDLKQLIEQCPEVLTDSAKLKSYILDLYPNCKRGMVNILVAIQQCGIVAEMQASKNSSAMEMSRWKKCLEDDVGFTGALAETCLQMWCSAIGIQLETKVNAEQKADTARSKVQNDNSQSKQTSVEVGDIYTFGTYQQDSKTSNGKKPIKWLVLAKEGNKILLISEKALDYQKYNDYYTNEKWETCSLREWLNSTFLNAAFSIADQEKIVSTTVPADKFPHYSINPRNAATDRVFLLNFDEVKQYFDNNEARKCVPTTYVIANGASTYSDYIEGGAPTCWWWLRSSSSTRDGAFFVHGNGSVYGTGMVNSDLCVRPALWINLDS